MRLLLIADTHDIVAHCRMVIAQAVATGPIDAILHMGDLAASATMEVLAEADLPIYYVIGNNEDDPDEVAACCTRLGVHFLGEQADIEIDGRRIAMTHYPRVAQSLATFGEFDLICFGHSHNAMKSKLIHGGWLVNPGNLAGWREGARYAIYDTKLHTVTHYDLEVRKKHWNFA